MQMKRLPYLTIVGAILGVLSACSPCKHITAATDTETRVEVHEKVVYVPDTILLTIPAQSVEHIALDSVSHLETDYAESDARINPDGTLLHTLRNKEQDKPTPIQRPIEYRDSIVYVDKLRTIEVPKEVEAKLTLWQKTQLGSYNILLIALLAALIWIFRKPLLAVVRRFI